MKKILLKNGMVAKVDDEDYEHLNQYTWRATRREGDRVWYCEAKINGKKRYMHQILLEPKEGYITDHINHDGLDNRKENLRYVTPRQNNMNARPRKGCASDYKGVGWHKGDQRWHVYVYPEKGEREYVGSSDDEIEAAKMYNKAAKKYYGEYAYLNDV